MDDDVNINGGGCTGAPMCMRCMVEDCIHAGEAAVNMYSTH
jgi:hypothetical protein